MPDKLLNEEITSQLRTIFNSQLIHPVEIILFLSGENCAACVEMRQLLEEVAPISEKIHLDLRELGKNQDLAQRFQIEETPALIVTGLENGAYLDYALRFYGIPAGYEFSSLIQGMLLVSMRSSGLQSEVREELHKITKPVNIKVFVTPT